MDTVELTLLVLVTLATFAALALAFFELRRVQRCALLRFSEGDSPAESGADAEIRLASEQRRLEWDLVERLNEQRRSLTGAGTLGHALARILLALGGALCLFVLAGKLAEGTGSSVWAPVAMLGVTSLGALGCRKLGQVARQVGRKRADQVRSLATRLLG